MPKKGYKQTLEHRLKCAQLRKGQRLGANHPSWKGGRVKHVEGYIYLRRLGHPKATQLGSYVFKHRLVMENYLGRYLEDDEVVDHINGIKDDNRLENLRLFKSQSQHMKIEGKRGKMKKSLETRQKLSNSHKIAYLNRDRDNFGRFI